MRYQVTRPTRDGVRWRIAGAAVGMAVPLVLWIAAYWLQRAGPPRPTPLGPAVSIAFVLLVVQPFAGFGAGPRAVSTDRPNRLVGQLGLVVPALALASLGVIIVVVELLGLDNNWPGLALWLYGVVVVPAFLIGVVIEIPFAGMLVIGLRYLRRHQPRGLLVAAATLLIVGLTLVTVVDASTMLPPPEATRTVRLHVVAVNRSPGATGVDIEFTGGNPTVWRLVVPCAVTVLDETVGADWELRVISRSERNDPDGDWPQPAISSKYLPRNQPEFHVTVDIDATGHVEATASAAPAVSSNDPCVPR